MKVQVATMLELFHSVRIKWRGKTTTKTERVCAGNTVRGHRSSQQKILEFRGLAMDRSSSIRLALSLCFLGSTQAPAETTAPQVHS
jgi:hypothetical protein